MNRSGLDELKEGSLGFELGSVDALHVEGAGHRAEGRRQRAARGVFKGLPRLEHWLLSDDAGSVDLLDMARAVDDRPMPVQQLDRGIADIRDSNGVEKEPAAHRRIAVLRRIACADLNADAGGFGFRGGFEEIAFRHRRHSSSQALLNRGAIRQ
jgi:hypothetical protein